MKSNYSELGIFIGLTTFPITNNISGFIEKEINPVFVEYKDKLQSYLTKKNNVKNELEIYYRPSKYYLFGKFDLGIISIIDDFEFCGRAFRPFNEFGDAKYSSESSFDYKIIAGIHEKTNSEISDLESVLPGIRLNENSKQKKYPFIGICNLKVNNLVLLNKGFAEFNKYFYELVKELAITNKNQVFFKPKIIESFGASEYTLLLFSNSFTQITNTIIEIRELAYTQHPFDGVSMFESSNSTYGFDFNLFEHNLKQKCSTFEIPDDYYQPLDSEEISLNTRWFLKPTYLENFKKGITEIKDDIEQELDEETLAIFKKNSDFRFRVTPGLGDVIPFTRDYVKLKPALFILMKKYIAINNEKLDFDYILESRSLPIINIEDNNAIRNDVTISKEDKVKFRKNSSKWFITESEIKNVIEELRRLGIAKVIRNKVAKTLSNYNNVISDPVLFLYMLDLTDYIKKSFLTSVKLYQRENLTSQINVLIRDQILFFENAYYNRFFQSASTREVTDFNTEYFGAIHQIISAYDFSYKSYNKIFEGDISYNLVVVGSTPKIKSTQNFIKINYFHVFQPEIFVAICCHESSNFFFDKFDKTNLKLLGNKKVRGFFHEAGLKFEHLSSHSFNTGKNDSPLVERVKEKLKRDADYPFYAKFVEEYLDPDKKLFKSFIKDIITLKVGYSNDEQLFETWHWVYFSQMSMNYESENNINDEKFCMLFIRLSLILTKIGPTGRMTLYPFRKIFNRKAKAPNKALQHPWTKNFDKVMWLVSNILEIKEVQDFREEMMSFYERLVVFNHNNFSERKDILSGIQSAGSEQNKNLEREKLNKEYSKSTKRLITSDYSLIKSSLISGQIIEKQKNKSDLYNVNCLFYSLLKYFQDDIWLKKNNDSVGYIESYLVRRKGKPSIIDGVNYADILIDQQGGFFCYCKSTRNTLFVIRNTFVKSLWNMSLDFKKERFFEDFE